MKNEKFKVVGYVLMAGLLIVAGLSKAHASDYLGEFCWDLNVGGQNEAKFKLAVTDMGGGHYIVNGTNTFSASNDNAVHAVHGNAEIVGNEVMLTLNSSDGDSVGTSISTFNIRLNMPSLNGTFRSINQDYSSGTRVFEPLDHTEGAVTITSCK